MVLFCVRSSICQVRMLQVWHGNMYHFCILVHEHAVDDD